MTTLFEKEAPHPLADRLRPQRLADIVGQDYLLGPKGPIGRMVASRQLASMILWGPPGCGKTTIARLLAHGTDLVLEPLSAVFSGVADLRKVFDAAKKRRPIGQGTLLFVDEIHRFNRAQQDAFLPSVEDGTVILVGATTENPSFELIGALLSRAKVFVLRRLDDDDLETLLRRAEQHLGQDLPLTKDGRERLEDEIRAVGQEARHRRLAAARWAPQDHRGELAAGDHAADRSLGAQEMILPDDVGEVPWAQPVGQRMRRLFLEQRGHRALCHLGVQIRGYHAPHRGSARRL